MSPIRETLNPEWLRRVQTCELIYPVTAFIVTASWKRRCGTSTMFGARITWDFFSVAVSHSMTLWTATASA
jgi:hypothetical protein